MDVQERELKSLREVINKLSSELISIKGELSETRAELQEVRLKKTKESENSSLSYASVAMSSDGNERPQLNTGKAKREQPARTSAHVNVSSSQRKSNLIVFGLEECGKGTARHMQDIEMAGELFSWLDNIVTSQSIIA